MKGMVTQEASRPLALDRLAFPEAVAENKIQPFIGGVRMPYNIRNPEEKGNFIEGVTVLAVDDNGDRVFVKFYRTGNTAWIDTDRLCER